MQRFFFFFGGRGSRAQAGVTYPQNQAKLQSHSPLSAPLYFISSSINLYNILRCKWFCLILSNCCLSFTFLYQRSKFCIEKQTFSLFSHIPSLVQIMVGRTKRGHVMKWHQQCFTLKADAESLCKTFLLFYQHAYVSCSTRYHTVLHRVRSCPPCFCPVSFLTSLTPPWPCPSDSLPV